MINNYLSLQLVSVAKGVSIRLMDVGCCHNNFSHSLEYNITIVKKIKCLHAHQPHRLEKALTYLHWNIQIDNTKRIARIS